MKRYPKPTRDTLGMYLVEMQMEAIGKTFEDAESTPEWFNKFTMTQEEFLEFKSMAISIVKKVYKCNKRIAESNFDWWNLNWGLRIYPLPPEIQPFKHSPKESRVEKA